MLPHRHSFRQDAFQMLTVHRYEFHQPPWNKRRAFEVALSINPSVTRVPASALLAGCHTRGRSMYETWKATKKKKKKWGRKVCSWKLNENTNAAHISERQMKGWQECRLLKKQGCIHNKAQSMHVDAHTHTCAHTHGPTNTQSPSRTLCSREGGKN